MPTLDQARQFTRTVEPHEAFVATLMSPSSGGRAVPLVRLERVEQFLEGRSFEDFQAAGFRLDLHYIDFGALSEWLDEVTEDAELAELVRELHAADEGYGEVEPKVKALLRERLDQCAELLAAEEPVEGGEGES